MRANHHIIRHLRKDKMKESYGKPSDLITPKEFIGLFYGPQVYVERNEIDNRITSVLDPFFGKIEEPSSIMEELGRLKILIEGAISHGKKKKVDAKPSTSSEGQAIKTIISAAMPQREPAKLLKRIAEIMEVMMGETK